MASKKPADSNGTPLSNVRIKVEPGASTAPPLRNIKIEPGLSASTTRLTSFRVPRDLTLGANIKTEKPKKIYTPNVNAQRNKKKEDGSAVKKETKSVRGKGRGRGQADRGRGRGKTPGNLIQSSGVFSEGITDSSRTGRRFSGYRDSSESKKDSKTFMEKPVLNLNQTIDKADEDEKLKTLLKDDFIDDGSDPTLENAPVSLPLVDEGKLYKSELKTETEMKVAPEDEEIDVKPIILANGEAVMPSKSMKAKIKPRVDKKDQKADNTISQIMENQTNGYVLIQYNEEQGRKKARLEASTVESTPVCNELGTRLVDIVYLAEQLKCDSCSEPLLLAFIESEFPDCLPGFRTGDEPTDPRPRRQTEQNSNPPPPPPPPSSQTSATDGIGKSEFCTLESLKGGLLGKIQIRKSGKARFLVGDNAMIVDVGSRPSFRQDLVATKIDADIANSELVNLGRVNNTLICSPDWETMLACL